MLKQGFVVRIADDLHMGHQLADRTDHGGSQQDGSEDGSGDGDDEDQGGDFDDVPAGLDDLFDERFHRNSQADSAPVVSLGPGLLVHHGLEESIDTFVVTQKQQILRIEFRFAQNAHRIGYLRQGFVNLIGQKADRLADLVNLLLRAAPQQQ